ncbi:MAG: hypothetical protein L0I76_28525, partial [Pseudonocardia sp.]|nr:hypothetical protein [Pseudonocardia sp.]
MRRLCACGCGKPTPHAGKTNKARGLIKGEPTFYLRGHGGARRGGQATAALAAVRRRAAEDVGAVPVSRLPAPPVAAAPEPLTPAELYGERLAHASELIVGAVHDEGPVAVREAMAGALALAPPPGVDPVTALITVLAAQV